MSSGRTAMTAAGVAISAALAIYVGAYVLLCLRSGEDTDRYFGTGEGLFLRGYRWSWCATAFAPVARVESACRGRRVVIIVDRDWCPQPWWAWWPLDA